MGERISEKALKALADECSGGLDPELGLISKLTDVIESGQLNVNDALALSKKEKEELLV